MVGSAWQGVVGINGRGHVCGGEAATEAGGTHPTGMHSCLSLCIRSTFMEITFLIFTLRYDSHAARAYLTVEYACP